MRLVFMAGAGALALALAACDAGPSAAGKAPPTATSTTTTSSRGVIETTAADPRDAAVPAAADGKPMWAPNRKHTAEENADYQFGKNGKDFGAVSEADYVTKAHRFIDAPPAGVQKLERANGDALLYDAKSNTFAVVTKAGAPRTMFKPRDGAAYWRQQVSREATSSKASDNGDS
jgi:pyocin large subunit-like protein